MASSVGTAGETFPDTVSLGPGVTRRLNRIHEAAFVE